MDELKTCPFCGGKARLFVGAQGICVMCMDCFCETGAYIDESIYWKDCEIKTATETVIERWNRRVENGYCLHDALHTIEQLKRA